MSITVERRFSDKLTVNRASDNSRSLSGYAVVWNSLSNDLGGFVESFAPTAFSDFFANGKSDVRALVNHDSAKIIGRQSASTLILAPDDFGLGFRIDVAPTSYGDDLLASVERGDITGMSFGFVVAPNGATYQGKNPIVRTINRAKLVEISAVTFPAYEASSVAQRVDPQIAMEIEKAHGEDLKRDWRIVRQLLLEKGII